MTDKPDIEAVLVHYGADHVPTSQGGWMSMRCPFHDETHPSASVNTEAFVCHACGMKGDSLALIQLKESVGFREAVALAKQIDADYEPTTKGSRGRGGRKKTGRRWSPPGRRGRQPWA